MTLKLFLSIFLVCSLTGCLSTINMWNADTNIKKIELGMSKIEIVSIMGNTYKSIASMKTDDGNLEIIGYETSAYYYYMMHILDGKLVEWHRELVNTSASANETHHHYNEGEL